MAYRMADIDSWIDECRAALAQAERLSAQLERLHAGNSLRLGELTARIANLRAAIEALDAMRTLAAPSRPQQIHPDWINPPGPSPWCAPEGEG